MTRRVAKGFTLIELLVAMAIFGIIGALALGGLNAFVTQQSLAREDMQRLAELQRAIHLLTSDLAQVNPRVVRDTLGRATEPYLSTYGAGDYAVRLTRSGWRNPVHQPRGTLQRVQYVLDDETLKREYWPVLDVPLGLEPREEDLLTGVEDLELDYLDEAQVWHEDWPPLELAGVSSPPRPLAIRIRLTLTDWGEIERLVELVQ